MDTNGVGGDDMEAIGGVGGARISSRSLGGVVLPENERAIIGRNKDVVGNNAATVGHVGCGPGDVETWGNKQRQRLDRGDNSLKDVGARVAFHVAVVRVHNKQRLRG